jgi:hypothetical protein
MRQQKWWAADLRKHLEAAGVQREALYSTDDTEMVAFHEWSRPWSAVESVNHGPRTIILSGAKSPSIRRNRSESRRAMAW